jgi:amino-acid N-acetyltransferase
VKLTDLRGILQYIPRFREKIFVLAIDGAIVTDENFGNILLDIAVLRSLNIRVVIVHGASAQIRLLAEQQGIKPSNLDGAGVTDQPTLQLAMAAASRLTHEILEGLSMHDLRAATPNAIVADFIQALLNQGAIPVVPPLGFDGEGKTYRVNSDHMAAALAVALKAIKVIFITTADGLFRQGRLIRQMLTSDLEQVVTSRKDEIPADFLSKAIHAVSATKAGVQRVHIINGRVDEGLLAEVFSNEGIGTLIYANEYQQIRRALKKDVRHLMLLTKDSVANEELVKRTRSTIEKNLSDYYLFEIDKNPVACVALHTYPELNKGELAFLYVKPSHENQGIGVKLTNFAEKKARELGFERLFALSTQAYTFFASKAGFTEGSPDDLPPNRREKYDQSGRKSKVLVKDLRAVTKESPAVA